jgi:ABC-type uncharacterized transport system substrate-binding protein
MGNADDDPVRNGLKETLPKASRVAILWDPRGPGGAGHARETQIAAPALGVELQPVEVRAPEDLEKAFQAAVKGRAEALIVVHTGLLNPQRARIVNLALKTRLPTMYSSSLIVLEGGLMSYDGDAQQRYRGVANYVDKILKGGKPADLPVQQPTKFEFIINLKAAKQIGLTIPPNVLARADRVIK